MLISNTMRFGTDTFDLALEKLPCLKALINGETISVEMTDFKISSPSLVIRINGKNYYIRLTSPTNATKTPLRVKINGDAYAIASSG